MGFTTFFRHGSARTRLVALCLLVACVQVGCASMGIMVTGQSGGIPSTEPEVPSFPSYHTLNIPAEHLPRVGECRIWFPGKPPGQQPNPVPCDEAEEALVEDAWVLYRDRDSPELLEVREKKNIKAKVEIVVKNYLID